MKEINKHLKSKKKRGNKQLFIQYLQINLQGKKLSYSEMRMRYG